MPNDRKNSTPSAGSTYITLATLDQKSEPLEDKKAALITYLEKNIKSAETHRDNQIKLLSENSNAYINRQKEINNKYIQLLEQLQADEETVFFEYPNLFDMFYKKEFFNLCKEGFYILINSLIELKNALPKDKNDLLYIPALDVLTYGIKLTQELLYDQEFLNFSTVINAATQNIKNPEKNNYKNIMNEIDKMHNHFEIPTDKDRILSGFIFSLLLLAIIGITVAAFIFMPPAIAPLGYIVALTCLPFFLGFIGSLVNAINPYKPHNEKSHKMTKAMKRIAAQSSRLFPNNQDEKQSSLKSEPSLSCQESCPRDFAPVNTTCLN